MDKGLRSKWLAALRSGEYKQGKKALKNMAGEFCCLGLNCEVSGEGKWLPSVASSGFNYVKPDGCMSHCASSSPLQSVHPDVQFKLIAMNDEEGKTFPEIADWIEATIPVDPVGV